MKKKLALLMALVTSVTMIFGGSTFAEEGGAKALSLAQAKELATQNNTDLKLLDISVKQADQKKDQAEDAASSMKKSSKNMGGLNSMLTTFELAQSYYVLPEQAKVGLELTQKTQEVSTKQIMLGVEKAYTDVLKAKRLLDVKQLELDRNKEQLRMAQANLKAGTFAKIDVTGVEALVSRTEAELSRLNNDYKVAVMELDKLIGLDLKTPLKTTDQFKYEPMEQVDLDKVIETAMKDSLEIMKVEKDLYIKQLNADLAAKYYTPNTRQFKNIDLDKQAAELEVASAKEQIKLDVYTTYNNMKAAEDQIKVLEKVLAKDKETVRVTKLKYNQGLATNADMLSANLSLNETEKLYAEAVYGYNLAKAQFKLGLFSLGSAQANGAGM